MSDLNNILTQLQSKVDASKSEADGIISQAKKEADKIIQDAKAQAEQEVAKGKSELERLEVAHKEKLKQAVRDTLLDIKQNTLQSVLKQSLAKDLSAAANAVSTLEKAIVEACKAFAEKGEGELKILLSEKTYKENGEALKKSIASAVSSGVSLSGSSTFQSGFKLLSKDGQFAYDFSDQALLEVFSRAYGSELEAELLN